MKKKDKQLSIEITMPTLHSGQALVHASKARFRGLACGRRWGKTLLAVVTTLEALFQGKRGYWIAPTYGVTKVAWNTVKKVLRPMMQTGLAEWLQIREGSRSVHFGDGELMFRSGENHDNLRGEGLDFTVIDEAAYCRPQLWYEVVRPALADKQGWALFLSTPKRENDWFHQMILRGQRADNEWESWQMPSWTNPLLAKEEIEAARLEMPSIEFRREFGAEFVSADGARIKPHWIKQHPFPDVQGVGGSVTIGVDLAISLRDNADYTALVVLRRTPDGRLFVLDTIRDRLPFDRSIELIKQTAAKWKPSLIAVENVQYQAAMVQELHRTTTLPVTPVRPERDKITRFLPVEARYEQGLVSHCSGVSRDFVAELLSFPDSEHDDFIDAFSYAWQAQCVLAATNMSRPRGNHEQKPLTWSGLYK